MGADASVEIAKPLDDISKCKCVIQDEENMW